MRAWTASSALRRRSSSSGGTLSSPRQRRSMRRSPPGGSRADQRSPRFTGTAVAVPFRAPRRRPADLGASRRSRAPRRRSRLRRRSGAEVHPATRAGGMAEPCGAARRRDELLEALAEARRDEVGLLDGVAVELLVLMAVRRGQRVGLLLRLPVER